MAIETTILTAIDSALAEAPADHATLATLRGLASGCSVTRCDALDMREETPFRSYKLCEIFLVDGRNHCWAITQNPAEATGLVLAPKDAT